MWLLSVFPVFIVISCTQLTTVSANCYFYEKGLVAFCSNVGTNEFIYFTNKLHNDLRYHDKKIDLYIEHVDMPNEYLIRKINRTSRYFKKLQIANTTTNFSTTDFRLLYSLDGSDIHLDLSKNGLCELPNVCAYPFSQLIFRQNPIEYLNRTDYCNHYPSLIDLSQCNISQIDRDAFQLAGGGIRELNLSRNAIKSLNSSLRNHNLDVLDLSNNKLEILGAHEIYDVSTLYLQNNLLLTTSLDITTYPQIERWLYVSVTRLGNINNSLMNLRIDQSQYLMSEIEDLGIISMEENTLPSYAFKLSTKNYTLTKRGLSIHITNACVHKLSPDAFNGLFDVGVLSISYNNISKLENFTFRGASFSEVDLSFSQIYAVESQAFENASIKTLVLKYNNLTVIYLDTFRHIEEVDLSHNMIHKIHGSTLESDIQKLQLQYNNLTSAGDLGTLRNLKYLDLSSNAIDIVTSNFARGLHNLRVLDLSNNQLTQVTYKVFWPLVSLQWISLEMNPLETFNSSAFSYEPRELKTIGFSSNGSIYKNQFVRFDLLTSLNITNSKIRILRSGSLNGLYSLKSLVTRNATVDRVEPNVFVDLNKLTDVDFSVLLKYHTVLENGTFNGLKALTNLDITHTNITNLTNGAFEGLEYLRSLNISHNKIVNITVGAFIDLPHLELLKLSHNKLRYINDGTFSGLRSLKSLDLSYNNFDYFDVSIVFPITHLVHLSISHNYVKVFYNYSNLKRNNPDLMEVALNSNRFSCTNLLVLLQYFRQESIIYDSTNSKLSNCDGVYCYV